jgi:hypothetical protein
MHCEKNNVIVRFGNDSRDYVYYHCDKYGCKECNSSTFARFGTPFNDVTNPLTVIHKKRAIKIIW